MSYFDGIEGISSEKRRSLEAKFLGLEKERSFLCSRNVDVSSLVAKCLEGEELLYYQYWIENNRGYLPSEDLEKSESRWQQFDEESRYLAGDDNTAQEIAGYLGDAEEDEDRWMYEDDTWHEDCMSDLLFRGKKPHSFSNNSKGLRKSCLKMKILCQKVAQKIGILKNRISTLNKNRAEPLPQDYPDCRYLRILTLQLHKAQKQYLKSKLRLFSHQTQDLVHTILDENLVIGKDPMFLELQGMAQWLRYLENIHGHPNGHHHLLQDRGKKRRGYRRNNRKAVIQALLDNISF